MPVINMFKTNFLSWIWTLFPNYCAFWPILAISKSMIKGAGLNIAGTVYAQLLFLAIHDCFYVSILALLCKLDLWVMTFFGYINDFKILLKKPYYPNQGHEPVSQELGSSRVNRWAQRRSESGERERSKQRGENEWVSVRADKRASG